MADQRKRIDITSADSKQIGFDYQYLYFIDRLFCLKPGDEVGYESLDDVHVVSHKENKTYFYQTKHTIAITNSGEQINLTTLSEDLWKTLSNWSKLITDEHDGRKNKDAQKRFVKTSQFVFVANRNMGSNDVIANINNLVNDSINKTAFLDFLKELLIKTKDESIRQYISEVVSLGETVLAAFAKQIQFTNTPNDLISLIQEKIIDKMIRPEYADEVLRSLYYQLKKDFFDKVSLGQHQVIKYSEWISKYTSVFEHYRTTQLPLRTFSLALPEHLESQIFVKELIEIGAISAEDDGLAEIAEWTKCYLESLLQLEKWYQDGRITQLDLQQFHNNAIATWKNSHRSHHRSTGRDVNLDFKNAIDCFDDIMQKEMTLLNTELGTSLSNGEYIQLADEEKIGWKYSWKDRYYLK